MRSFLSDDVDFLEFDKVLISLNLHFVRFALL